MSKYPIYIPSKNRSHACQTVKLFLKDKVKFFLVVEPSQYNAYAKVFPADIILTLPNDDMRLLGSRLWIREHAIANGFSRHWQFDDNISCTYRLHKGRRIPCNSNIAIDVVEEFTDRYTNIGISGMNYMMFVLNSEKKPFRLNSKVYSASLINNEMPHKWRLLYNDDTDLCLQCLTAGFCTVEFNQFCVDKIRTMAVKGGNTDDLYLGNGRLKMARSLEVVWPKYVTVKWKFNRPQHHVDWSQFTQQLIRRYDIDWEQITNKQYSIKIVQKKEIKSHKVKAIYEELSKDN